MDLLLYLSWIFYLIVIPLAFYFIIFWGRDPKLTDEKDQTESASFDITMIDKPDNQDRNLML